jgi:hypothetical protein
MLLEVTVISNKDCEWFDLLSLIIAKEDKALPKELQDSPWAYSGIPFQKLV